MRREAPGEGKEERGTKNSPSDWMLCARCGFASAKRTTKTKPGGSIALLVALAGDGAASARTPGHDNENFSLLGLHSSLVELSDPSSCQAVESSEHSRHLGLADWHIRAACRCPLVGLDFPSVPAVYDDPTTPRTLPRHPSSHYFLPRPRQKAQSRAHCHLTHPVTLLSLSSSLLIRGSGLRCRFHTDPVRPKSRI